MAGWTVSEAKWKTCVCGKVCKGRAGLSNHGNKCDVEVARRQLWTICIEKGIKPLTHQQFIGLWTRNPDGVRAAIEKNRREA